MAASYETVFVNGTVVNQDGVGRRDVAVSGGRIVALGEVDRDAAGEVVDCTGLAILPGVIDTQVHFREPGAEHKEDLETGSRAAVMGGVTAVFEMPNTRPLTITAETLADKVKRGTGRMHCDFAFFVGGTAGNAGEVGELERLPGAAGIKIFMGSSTGDLLVPDDESLRAILRNTRRRVSIHAEDEPRLNARKGERREGEPASHPVWRDETTAMIATERLVKAARAAGARVHLLHVSTAEEMDFIAAHKDYVSVEVTPQHLTLTADDYARLGTRLQMNPPIRAARHRARLWQGVQEGVADILGSDHAPHTLEEKAKPYPASPSGMPGVQTLVPVMLDHVAAGRMSVERFVDMTSSGPARLFNIARKGRIAVGYDADLTIVDLKRRETITDAWSASRAAWTPYDGLTVTGWPIGTVVRGRRVMWEGELVTPSTGAAVRFGETLARAT
ncbi:MAG: dihydroorotase [Rhizobiales bacterium]|nr:dihydroorotase [Hyphomicrobiales bacterium]